MLIVVVIVVNFSHFNLLLQYHLANFYQTRHKAYLVKGVKVYSIEGPCLIICVYWLKLFSQVSDVAHGPLVMFTWRYYICNLKIYFLEPAMVQLGLRCHQSQSLRGNFLFVACPTAIQSWLSLCLMLALDKNTSTQVWKGYGLGEFWKTWILSQVLEKIQLSLCFIYLSMVDILEKNILPMNISGTVQKI